MPSASWTGAGRRLALGKMFTISHVLGWTLTSSGSLVLHFGLVWKRDSIDKNNWAYMGLTKAWVWISSGSLSLLPIFLHCQKLFVKAQLTGMWWNVFTVGTESIQTPLNFSLFVILQPFAKIIYVNFFFLINVHTAPHIDRKTQNCWHFCRLLKRKTEISHGPKYSDPLLWHSYI